MRNHEITKVQPLLDEKGYIREPGWSRRMYQEYSRAQIRVCPMRIKEWDYYAVMADQFAVAFTISDDGYIGLQSVSFLNLTEQSWEKTRTILNPFPMGRLGLSGSSLEGDTWYGDKKLRMKFSVKEGKRRIQCRWKKFYHGEDFSCDIVLDEPPMDSMVIATPWARGKAFYYNQKINCMPARGVVRLGDRKFMFQPDRDFGILDWGRGVWTYDNTWYWASGNGWVEGKPFGFNLGYGFGDTSAATENIIFYRGRGHKLDDITFCIPEENYEDRWLITSSDSRFEMIFTPILDRASNMNVGIIQSDQHQVFGRFSGKAVLDDGTVLEVKDVMGFAEKVHNRY